MARASHLAIAHVSAAEAGHAAAIDDDGVGQVVGAVVLGGAAAHEQQAREAHGDRGLRLAIVHDAEAQPPVGQLVRLARRHALGQRGRLDGLRAGGDEMDSDGTRMALGWHSDGTRMALGWQSDGTRVAITLAAKSASSVGSAAMKSGTCA